MDVSARDDKPAFRPVKRVRTFEDVCEQIRGQLATGALKPGDRLPSERELAHSLGVGRNALREALRSLENSGIIDLRKGMRGGAVISRGRPETMTQVMQDWLAVGAISLKELTEARILFMGIVVRLACERADNDDLRALSENIDRMEELARLKRSEERIDCTAEFYALLARATHNQVVSILVESLTQILRHFVNLGAGRRTQDDLVASRRRLVDCLRRRDTEGADGEITRQLTQLHHILNAAN